MDQVKSLYPLALTSLLVLAGLVFVAAPVSAVQVETGKLDFEDSQYVPIEISVDPDPDRNVIQEETGLGGSFDTSNTWGGTYDYITGGPVDIVAQIINMLLGLLGLFSLIMFIYGGYVWMIARGNEDEIGKAKDILTGTVIGLLLILASYSIMNYLFYSFVGLTVD